MIAWALTGAFAFFFLILSEWFVQGLRHLQPATPLSDAELPSATVLVAARNERDNAPALCRSLLALQYPADRLQILVIDDRSEDGTGDLISRLGENRLEVLRIEKCPEGIAPKKHALLEGLKQARGEIIAVADADNSPSPTWLKTHAAHLTGHTGVSAGLVYHAREAGISEAFHGLWAAEIFIFGAISAGAIGHAFPLSANGGNLAYRRQAFEEAGAYARNLGVISGDDDFLVQAVAARTSWKVDFAIEESSQVPTHGPQSWHQAWEQRKRWASKCVRYEHPQVLLLSIVFIGYLWALLLLPGIFLGFQSEAAVLWAALFLTGLRICDGGIRYLGPRIQRRWFPLAMAVQLPVAVAASILGTFGRFRWKDGAVKGGALR